MIKYTFSILTVLLLLSKISVGQTSDLRTKYRFYKLNSNRPHYLKKGKSIDVYIIDSVENSGNEFYVFKTKHIFEGGLRELNDTFLTIDIYSEYLSVANKDSSFNQTIDFVVDRQVSFPIDRIKHIQYETTAGGVFGVIAGLSLFSTIFIAPLASINYSNGKFDTERFIAIAKPSLIGSLVGLTLYYSFETRQLQIKPNR
ncbi:MAG: hypothetical protein Q8R57_00590 [Bacteroidota bacterium]|nr:hypothetical protein [Bacteroidota bacterium]